MKQPSINQLRRAMNRVGRKKPDYSRPGGYLHPTKGFKLGALPPYFRMSPQAIAQAQAAEKLMRAMSFPAAA